MTSDRGTAPALRGGASLARAARPRRPSMGSVAGIAVASWGLVCALASAPAAADESAASSSYEETIAAGLERYGARDWAAARALFARAHALEPGARTARGIGLSAYYAQDYVAAARAFEQALSDTHKPLSAEQRAQTEQLLRELHGRLAQVRVAVRPEGAIVSVDDEAIAGGVVVALAPGRHRLDVRLSGYAVHSEPLELAAGEARDLAIELQRVAPSPSASRSPSPPPVAAAPRASAASAAAASAPALDAAMRARPSVAPSAGGGSVWPWVAASATLAFAAGALAFGLAGDAELDELQRRCGSDCTERKRAALWNDSPIERYETLTNVALVAAGAAAATTVTLFVLEAGGTGGGGATARVHGVGLLVADRF